ncbi:hypothetical protein HMPREF1221_01321 [Treponema socranskii subsp. paredis ATCC 35535]|nr:hypothetical protein HMPREF1221_01321 [Treponema socranskii subsp. paredis ATCC 35535]
MKNILIAIIGTCMLCSCSASDVQIAEDNLLFFGSTDSDVWIGDTQIAFAALKEQCKLSGYDDVPDCFYDSAEHRLWLVIYSTRRAYDILENKVSRDIFFYEVKDKIADIQNPIVKKNHIGFVYGIDDGKVLISNDRDAGAYRYIISPLADDTAIHITINKGALFEPIAFKNNKIFFYKGYYKIDEAAFIPYENEWGHYGVPNDGIELVRSSEDGSVKQYKLIRMWEYFNVSADGKKLVGRDRDGRIMIYDLETKTAYDTGLKRDLLKGTRYKGKDLYYLDGTYLYFSKDTSETSSPIRHFLLTWYPGLIWYRHDLDTKETVGISAPSKFVDIVGKIK